MNRPTPLPVPSEVRLAQQELAQNAPASRALAVLNENNESETQPADELPPVPDHLRHRWQETYGRGPAPAAEKQSLFQRLSALMGNLLAPRQLAVAGGVAVIALAATLFIHSQGESTGEGTGQLENPVIVRGGNTPNVTEHYRLILVPPADGGPQFVKEFNLNWSKPTAEIVATPATAKDLLARPGNVGQVLLASVPDMEVTLWKNGSQVSRWPVSGANPTDSLDSLISQLETAAKTLNAEK